MLNSQQSSGARVNPIPDVWPHISSWRSIGDFSACIFVILENLIVSRHFIYTLQRKNRSRCLVLRRSWTPTCDSMLYESVRVKTAVERFTWTWSCLVIDGRNIITWRRAYRIMKTMTSVMWHDNYTLSRLRTVEVKIQLKLICSRWSVVVNSGLFTARSVLNDDIHGIYVTVDFVYTAQFISNT